MMMMSGKDFLKSRKATFWAGGERCIQTGKMLHLLGYRSCLRDMIYKDLSQKTARQRRQSHFSATVWTGFNTTAEDGEGQYVTCNGRLFHRRAAAMVKQRSGHRQWTDRQTSTSNDRILSTFTSGDILSAKTRQTKTEHAFISSDYWRWLIITDTNH